MSIAKLDRFRILNSDEKDRIRQEIIDDCELMTDGGCWIYRGTLNNDGYAVKYIQGRMRGVGRFMLAYKDREGMNAEGDACHGRPGSPSVNPDAEDCFDASACPRSCVNPDHLFWGTHGDNCKEKESVQFRFGWNARRRANKMRSLATGKGALQAATA